MDTTTYAASATVTRTVAEKKNKRRLPEVTFTPLDLVHLAPACGLKLVFRPFA